MKKKYELLSYPLSINTPVYGEGQSLKIQPERQIKKNEICNAALVSFLNHTGTHIDAPKHFNDSGRSVSEYDIEEFIFNFPRVVECSVKSNGLITPEDLENSKNYLQKCDLLLIRTGFSQYRADRKYRLHNPAISPEAAKLIRLNYENIKAVGIDTISVSSFQHRLLGVETHKIFFSKDEYKGSPLLLIEDMNLSSDLEGLIRVFAIPLILEGVDSMPCTVIGEFI